MLQLINEYIKNTRMYIYLTPIRDYKFNVVYNKKLSNMMLVIGHEEYSDFRVISKLTINQAYKMSKFMELET